MSLRTARSTQRCIIAPFFLHRKGAGSEAHVPESDPRLCGCCCFRLLDPDVAWPSPDDDDDPRPDPAPWWWWWWWSVAPLSLSDLALDSLLVALRARPEHGETSEVSG